MGWGVNDYPTAPREPQHDTCSAHGCKIWDGETFACEAKGCKDGEQLCLGCVWQCLDCQGDFCESHIADAMEELASPASLYLCSACLLRRLELTPKPMGSATQIRDEQKEVA
jgi:hypothetical protein